MSQLKKIYNLLDKKEKRIFFGILFLTLINTVVEILGITAVIPLISLILNQDLSLFENFSFTHGLITLVIMRILFFLLF